MGAFAVQDRAEVHDHVVGFYDGDVELIAALVSFFSDGFEHGCAAVVVATGDHRRALEEALTNRGVSIEALAASGRYRSFDARETLNRFLRNGIPDARAFSATIEPIILEAARAGSGVRVFGEMVALLWDAGDVPGAIELESMWNDLGADHAFTLYCAYPTSILGASGELAAAKAVCDRHSQVVAWSGANAGPVTSSDSQTFVRAFVPTPDALRAVRNVVTDVLGTWRASAICDDARVVACELATNAMVHARSPFVLSLSHTGSAVEIAVRDASSVGAELQKLDVQRPGGRGIAIIAGLAACWGTRTESDGKTVWATLPLIPT